MKSKEIYQAIDLSKVGPELKTKLIALEKATDGFTNERADANMDMAMNKIYAVLKDKKPESLKNIEVKTVEVEEKVETIVEGKPVKKTTKTKKKVAGKKKKVAKKTATPSSGLKKPTVSSVASKIRKPNESWSDALGRAKVIFNEKKQTQVAKTKKAVDDLRDFLKDDKNFTGWPRTYGKEKASDNSLERDSQRKAMPPGKRRSDTGRVYYENRDNRSDREANSFPRKIFLKEGGDIMIEPTILQNNPNYLVGTTSMSELFARGGITSRGLFEIQDEVYEKLKFESGSEIKSTSENRYKFSKAVDDALKARGIAKESLSKRIYDKLEDENAHTLNEFLILNDYFQPSVWPEGKKFYFERFKENPRSGLGKDGIVGATTKAPKGTSKGYISHDNIKLIIIKNPNPNGKKKFLQIDGSDVLNGVYDSNAFAKGGTLPKGYKYIRRADVSQVVTKKNEIIFNTKNGFQVREDALIKAGMNETSQITKTGTYSFPEGQVVWDLGNKSYGVVLNNFGDPKNGDRGEIRLDSDGMQSIYDYPDTSKYNLVPIGSPEDRGDKNMEDGKRAARSIISLSSSKDQKAEYQRIYKDLLDGKFDKFQKMADGGEVFIPTTYLDYNPDYLVGTNTMYEMFEDGGIMARGGFVSKGELIWRKLSLPTKMKFLSDNFTPEITPRSQEILVSKDFNFLPKNVKIVLESKYANVEDYADGGIMAKGGDINMDEVEAKARFYTDESKWTTKPTILQFEKQIKEAKDLKEQLDNKEIRPSKIIGSGFKSNYARPLAYKYLNEQILIAEKAIEILKQREGKMSFGGMMAKGGEVSVYNLRKGDKVKTRKGDIETILKKNSNGNYETLENDYTHNPESLEFISRPSRKMAKGGAMEHMVFKGDKVLAIHRNMVIVESDNGVIQVIDFRTEPIARRMIVELITGKNTLASAMEYIDADPSFKKSTMAMGGSLQGHGFEVGDLIVEDLGGYIRVVSEDGKDFFITLKTGDRETEAPLPFKHGGKVKHSDGTRLATKTNEAGDEVVDLTEFYEGGGNVPKVFDVPAQFLDSEGKRKNDRETIKELTDFVLALPQTKEIYYNDELGDYTPSRKKLHAEIINKFKKEVVCINNDKPIAIFMGGSPASGKSSFLRKYSPFLLKEEILKIDADEVRAMLPEYEGWNACQTHLETKDIVNILLSNKNIGIPCDFDIIYDGTMNSVKSYIPLMDILRKRGYKIFIVFMDNVPKDVIIKRALDRYKSSGRFVPLEVIEDFFSKGKTAFNELKKDVDGYMLIDGSSQDYKVLEEGGMKLPRDREYSKLGTKIKASDIPVSYKKGGLSKLY